MTRSVVKASGGAFRLTALAVALSLTAVSGCTTREMFNQGYVIDESALELTPVGSSREQVLLSLGTPSTTATFDNEVFYYISQKRTRPAMFMKPTLVSQNVLAVYFDEDGTVSNIANYTLKDGKAFDMISRTTPTGGKDQTFLVQMLTGATGSRSAESMGRSLLGGGN